jgi:hypothetical protein
MQLSHRARCTVDAKEAHAPAVQMLKSQDSMDGRFIIHACGI